MKFCGCWLAFGLAFAGESGLAASDLAEPCRSTPLFFIEDAPNRFLIQVPGTSAVFTPDGVEFHTGGSVVRAKFQGAKDTPRMQGMNPMGFANVLVGQDPSAWRTGLRTHRSVRYADLYPGIDLIYSGTDGRIKSEYRVAKGANPGEIQVAYSVDLSIDAEGRLHAGNLIEAAPVIISGLCVRPRACRGPLPFAGCANRRLRGRIL